MLFYDQRCHGDSKCEEFDFNGLADDLRNLLEHYEIKNPILVGHSMGGMVALTYFVRGTDISGLFLIGTSASTPEPEKGSPKYFLNQFGEMNRSKWSKEVVENYVGDQKTKSGKLAYEELLEAEETEIKCGLRSMIEYNITEQLKNADPEAVVICGERDGAITIEKSLELANLLNCEIIETDSSHLITFENPEIISERIRSFVDTLQE